MSQHPTDLFKTKCGSTAPLELNVSGPSWASAERRVCEQPFVLVGRHERASLRLEDAAVSRRHAYLQQIGGRIFCVDLGSRTGIRWGGEPRPAGWLRPDQEIRIGPFSLELAMAAQNGRSLGDEVAEEWDPLQDRVDDSRALPWIIVEGDNKVLARLRMNRMLVLVGSSPACRIRLREAGVARYHCSLLRSPEGVCIIDLLNEAGTCLNGQPVRWALLKEGDQLQVGPYVLRLWYQDLGTATSSGEWRMASGEKENPSSLATRHPPLATTGSPSLEIPPQPDVLPVPPGNVLVQTLAVPPAEQPVAEESSLVPALQEELSQARERLGEAEVVRQRLADSQAECMRLCNQVRTLEIQLTEAADLQIRLDAAEANERELEVVRVERDRWQTEAQTLQYRLASVSAEREQSQQGLEAVQRQLVEEQEAVRAMGARLGLETAALQGVQADLATRNAEHSAALQRLQESQDELSRLRDEAGGLRAELEQARARLQDAETFKHQLADTQAKHDQLCACIPELKDRANSADRLWERLRVADAETEQLRVQLRAADSRLSELEPIHAECVRLRDEARALGFQLAEATGLQARLEAAEASASELDVVCAERDHWQIEVQTLQTRLASEVAERDKWQQRLESARRLLVEEREAVRAVEIRLDQESAALQGVRTDLAARNAEYSAALQRLQKTQDELACSQDEKRGLQAALEQSGERLRDEGVFRQQLADSQAECARLCDQVRTLEIQFAEMADLQTRLEAAEANAHELDAVCAERDQWRDEAQTLRNRPVSDSVERQPTDCLAAALQAAREERDRLHTEQQAALHSAEQAWARVADLERALTEGTAFHERAVAEARARCESEQQALEARLEQERKTYDGATQAAVREVQMRAEAAIRAVQARAAAEREEWRQRIEGAEAQIVWERGLFQEQSEQSRRQVAALNTERDHLASRLAQAELLLRSGEERSRNEAGRVSEPEHLRPFAVLDQLFAEFRGIQMGHLLGQAARNQGQDKQAEQGRTRVHLECGQVAVGEQCRLTAMEQGVEVAWAEAGGGRERLTAIPNPPSPVKNQVRETCPDAGEKKTVEDQFAPCTSQAVQPDTAGASISSDLPQEALIPVEARQAIEDLGGSLAQRKDETSQRRWRRIFNFVLGKL
jgi:pSer/pThr/pTyr-binding forkhead associated (FHA) protein